jgi:trk system potassium uptake protein
VAFERLHRSVNIEVGASLNLVGALLKYLSLAFLFPVPLALGYSEPWWPYAAAGAITALAGWGLERVTHGREHVGIREGFLVVSLERISSPARSTRSSRRCRG